LCPEAAIGAGPPGRDNPRIARIQVIGRVSLYSLTCLLVFLVVGSILGLAWMLTRHTPDDLPTRLLRIVLIGTYACGAIWLLNLELVYRFLVPDRDYLYQPLRGATVHAALTAYNDEVAIEKAVEDFRSVPEITLLIVVDNNSSDGTSRAAVDAGAHRVVIEKLPGYGSCCMRALAEAARDSELIILCEGDMTFRASDVPKLLAYLENADLVLGTRATQELRERGTQMDWLINPANQIVAKLIQVRFWGTRLTDVGCTFRAIRSDAYRRLAPRLRVRGNHFSSHMIIEALKIDLRVIEVPVTFRRRVGVSKGVGSNKLKAARAAISILGLLYRA
jgi:hypothetical protein